MLTLDCKKVNSYSFMQFMCTVEKDSYKYKICQHIMCSFVNSPKYKPHQTQSTFNNIYYLLQFFECDHKWVSLTFQFYHDRGTHAAINIVQIEFYIQ